MCKLRMDVGEDEKTTWWLGPQVADMGDQTPKTEVKIMDLKAEVMILKATLKASKEAHENFKRSVDLLEGIPNKTEAQKEKLKELVEVRGRRSVEIVEMQSKFEVKNEELRSYTEDETENASISSSD